MNVSGFIPVGEFLVVTFLGLWLLKKVYALKGEVRAELESYLKRVETLVEKEKQESILNHRRTDVQDQILSEITEDPFSSRVVAEGSQNRPRIHGAIRTLTLRKD